AHVDPEQHAKGHGRRSDRELQQLEPDNLVNQRGGTGADEQQKQGWQPRRSGATMSCGELGLQGGHVTPDTIICIVLFTSMTRVNASTAVRRTCPDAKSTKRWADPEWENELRSSCRASKACRGM